MPVEHETIISQFTRTIVGKSFFYCHIAAFRRPRPAFCCWLQTPASPISRAWPRFWRATSSCPTASGRAATGILINGTGAIATGIVATIIVATEFIGGAWIVIALIPIIAWQLGKIRRHYDRVANQLSIDPAILRAHDGPRPHPHPREQTSVVIPIAGLNRATLRAVRYAEGMSSDVTRVHVTDEPADAEALRQMWHEAHLHPLLVIIDSPYRNWWARW